MMCRRSGQTRTLRSERSSARVRLRNSRAASRPPGAKSWVATGATIGQNSAGLSSTLIRRDQGRAVNAFVGILIRMDPALPPVPPPEAILARLGPIVRETVIVEGRSFLIERPSESDRLLDEPAVHAAFQRDEYMPYWADLWPAARMLAKVLLHESWPAGTQALEIGCGLGLAGIVALAMGLEVTFSDYDTCALRFAAANARLNGLTGFHTLQLD